MGTKIEKLEDLAKKWGDAYAKDKGTTCEWVDIYAKRSEMKEYPDKKITPKAGAAVFDPKYKETPLQGQVFTSKYDNSGSDGTGSARFEKTKETETSFTWSLSTGIEVGYTEEITVGVPDIASSKSTLSVKLTVTSTKTQTKSEKNTWDIERSMTVPPRTFMEMAWTVQESELESIFYIDVELTGYFAVWLKNKWNDHHLYFVEVASAFGDMKDFGVAIPDGYTVKGKKVIYRVTGACNGKTGIADVFLAKNVDVSESAKLLSALQLAEMAN